jgi:hypothetical protein
MTNNSAQKPAQGTGIQSNPKKQIVMTPYYRQANLIVMALGYATKIVTYKYFTAVLLEVKERYLAAQEQLELQARIRANKEHRIRFRRVLCKNLTRPCLGEKRDKSRNEALKFCEAVTKLSALHADSPQSYAGTPCLYPPRAKASPQKKTCMPRSIKGDESHEEGPVDSEEGGNKPEIPYPPRTMKTKDQ